MGLNNALLLALVLVFCTWAVYLGGLASMQAQCNTSKTPDLIHGTENLGGIRGFSATVLSCATLFRYYWFIMAWQFFIIFACAFCLVTHLYQITRMAWMGMFLIATILFMHTSDTFLAATDSTAYADEYSLARARTTAAGAIMTATVNVIIVIIIGLDVGSTSKRKSLA